MADENSAKEDTTMGRAKAKAAQAVGWATGDRRVEAEGKVELDRMDRSAAPDVGPQEAPEPAADASGRQSTDVDGEREGAVVDAEREVRRAHQELPPD